VMRGKDRTSRRIWGCPECDAHVWGVIDSRWTQAAGMVRRRRECAECGYRMTTYEMLAEQVEGNLREQVEDALTEGLMQKMRPVLVGMLQERFGLKEEE